MSYKKKKTFPFNFKMLFDSLTWSKMLAEFNWFDGGKNKILKQLLRIKILSFCILLFCYTGQADVGLACESSRSLILNDGVSPNPETFRLTQSNQGRTLRHSAPEYSLIYNTTTGQFFVEGRTGQMDLVERNSEGGFGVRENTESRNPTFRPLPTPLRNLMSMMQSLGQEALLRQVQTCGRRQSFREQLRNPLTDLEVNKCRHDLNLLSRMTRCFEQNTCTSVIDSLSNFSTTSPPYSFVRLFEERVQVTDPMSELALPFAADSVASNAGTGALVANRAAVGSFVARFGLRFNSAFALFQALSLTTKPLIFALVYDDQCGSQSLAESQGDAIEDCVGRNAHSLMGAFANDIQSALTHPDQYIQQVDQAPNGLGGRLACYAIEHQLNEWRERIRGYQNFSCRGRMILTSGGNNYIVGENNSFYRHENRDRTYHFRAGQPMEMEDRNSGVRTIPIPVNSLPSNRRVTAEEVIPMQVVYEETIMAAMLPRYQQEFVNGQCRSNQESPSENETPSAQ